MKNRNFKPNRSHTIPVLIWEEGVAKTIQIVRLSPRRATLERWLRLPFQPWPPRRFIMLRPKPM